MRSESHSSQPYEEPPLIIYFFLSYLRVKFFKVLRDHSQVEASSRVLKDLGLQKQGCSTKANAHLSLDDPLP